MTGKYRLGIDAGGTFTDAVVLDADDHIVATAKSLTTRFDLSEGIGASLDKLPAHCLADIGLVSLSTTLTTNSVVEGRGSPICVLLAGFDAAQIKASGLVPLIGLDAIVSLAGGHNADGMATQELDVAQAREAIVRMAPRVSAFAIASTFAVRNPAHELQLRQLVQSLCDKPVTCGHELASSLGAPRRAMTVALNARMISHVKTFIESVQTNLAQRRIHAPLMMVQGDGSVIDVHMALQRPVGTVLSGPAASVIGACALSATRDGIVADMGGTTTDIAVVRGGQPELSFDGAMIGHWRPMVEAVKVYAVGLGGDSEVRFLGGAGMAIGPRRVLPLSLLAHTHPQLLPVLERQQHEAPHGSQMRFVQRLQADAHALALLADDEQRAWQALANGPIDMEPANLNDRGLARALARLERKGLAIYSGFTPTDAAHVLGLLTHWSQAGAVCAARIWARQMRHMYGLGKWAPGDAEGPARAVLDSVVDTVCHKLIEAGLNDAGELSEGQANKMAGLLTRLALKQGQAGQPGAAVAAFGLRFAPDLPLIGVGAPAATFYPDVARALALKLVSPAHAAVANAVGAVLAPVSQRVHITVSQPVRGLFRVFAPQGPQDFSSLDAAVACARELAGAQALKNALEAGASQPQVVFTQWNNQVSNDIDGDVFFEARITATASGAPGYPG